MGQNSILYFLRGDKARVIWDPVKNRVWACCDFFSGIFATKEPGIADMLRRHGYKAVSVAQLEGMGFTRLPPPDQNVDQSSKAWKDMRKRWKEV